MSDNWRSVLSEDSTQSQLKEVQLLQRLLECARLLNSTLDLKELTAIVLRIIRDQVGFERGTLFVIDKEKQILRSYLAEGLNDFEIQLPLGSGIAGTAAESGSLLDIPDVSSDDRFQSSFDQALGYRTRDVYCMPVRNDKAVTIGVLQFLNRSRSLTREDADFLAAVSIHLGLALERAWLHHQLNEKHEMERKLRQAQEELTHREKLSLIGALTAGLAHELRNPLASLLAHIELLQEDADLGSGTRARVEKINASANSALNVANSFLSFSRRDDASPDAVHLNPLIEETVAMIEPECHKRDAFIETRLSDVPAVQAVRGQLQQVLLNLLKNGLDAIRSTGARTIVVTSLFVEERNASRIEVTDSGAGVPNELEHRLFEPFFTTKSSGKGAGLGLSICSKLVEANGGRIGYIRQPQGSTFWFELPAAQAAVDASTASENSALTRA